MGMIGELLRKATSTPDAAPDTAPLPTLGPTPPQVPAATPQPTPADTPTATPLLHAESIQPRSLRRAPKLYPVLDRYGTVIGHSDWPVPQETPSIHVDAFIGWLGTLEGFAGQRVLAKEMGRLYAAEFCRAQGLEPFPWQTIAAELTGMPDIISRKYHPVPGSPGRKRVCYLVPDLRAPVVDLAEAARRRA